VCRPLGRLSAVASLNGQGACAVRPGRV
jgi:hypothetical protein